MQICSLMRYLSLLLLSLLLAACGNVATITPSTNSTNGHADSTVVAQSTPVQTTTTASGDTYAFVRGGQLWVAINGASPVQATHFDYGSAGSTLNVFFGQPLWFANDRYVAFTLKVLTGGGLGGGGCGFVGDYGRSGELFVLDTTSMQLTQVSVPSEQSIVSPVTPYDGHWEYLFSEDATHLLAWHNDMSLKGASGLYRYDLNAAHSLTLTIPASSVPGADNQEAWSPMRYSSGQLYYETMTRLDGGNNTVYTIYSHSVSNPGTASTKVLNVGSEPFCVDQGNGSIVTGPFTEPGWDVSADGKYLVAQTMVTSGKTTMGSIKVLTLGAGTTLTLFDQVPTQELNQDASLSWSKDGGAVVLESLTSSSKQITLDSVIFLSPTISQSYNTNGTLTSVDNRLIHVVWQAHSSVFSVSSSQQFDLKSGTNAYNFIVGQPKETLLLANAYNFAWG